MQSFLDFIWDCISLLFNKKLILRIPIGYGSNYIYLDDALIFAIIFCLLIFAIKRLMRA